MELVNVKQCYDNILDQYVLEIVTWTFRLFTKSFASEIESEGESSLLLQKVNEELSFSSGREGEHETRSICTQFKSQL